MSAEMAVAKMRAAVAVAFLAAALTACASQSRTAIEASLETETQRQTTALASETTTEIDRCVAAFVAQQTSNTEAEARDIADSALSQCAYLLDEFQHNDSALVLATDPNDGVSSANQRAKLSEADLSKSARRRAIEIVQKEQEKLAQQ